MGGLILYLHGFCSSPASWKARLLGEEMARRGFRVTAVDFSSGMLAIARANASAAGVEVEFIECAAQDFTCERQFDAAISLCEGALCLFADSDDVWRKDMAIFANMAKMLAPGRPFLVTVLSAMRLIRTLSDSDVASGAVDLFTMTTRFTNGVDVDGRRISIKGIERYYTPPELVRMVNRVGLKVDRVYGGTAGNWRRGRIQLDEIEFMAVGHRI